MWLAVSGFMVMGLVSGLSLAAHLAWPTSGLTQHPSWWRAHLSAKLDSSEEDSGRLVGHIIGWRLLPPFGPSRILLLNLVFGGSTVFLIGTSCCKITRASARPRWAISVNGSLTVCTLTVTQVFTLYHFSEFIIYMFWRLFDVCLLTRV